MNYPVWQLDFAGGGLLIALIATIHVFVAQFAVGGGLFLVLTELKGRRDKDPAIIAYLKRHTTFFMLLTLVLGSLTGIGIWFTISLISPAATSTLIHTFVFAWSVEWLFFLAEIISIFIYAYTFERLSARDHLAMGFIYFGCAWMSLFFVSGIIDFMLTPGSWLASGSFWAGFFNPTFWPALFFRTFLSFILAGLFGFLTAAAIKEHSLRHTLMRYCATWLLAPFLLLLASAWWYSRALPPTVKTMIFDLAPELEPFLMAFALCSALLVLGGLVMAMRLPAKVNRTLAGVMLLIGFLYLGAFEFIREGGRRPYIIYDYMYANSILKSDMATIGKKGLLHEARWVKHRALTTPNQAVGKEIFDLLCLCCHSIGGPMNDIRPLTEELPAPEIEKVLATMGKGRPYMPPFPGTPEEGQALVRYLSTTLHQRAQGP
jgi:cytochrome bd-type quinol oxidase subunit 1